MAGVNEGNIRVTNAGTAKYMAIGIGYYKRIQDFNARLDIYTVGTGNVTIETPLYPTTDSYKYYEAPNVLRTVFRAGDKYIDTTTGINYSFTKTGSYGTTTATATGTSGNTEITVTKVSDFIVGDIIEISGTQYSIVGIDDSNSKLVLNQALSSDISDAAITFVNPEYVTPVTKDSIANDIVNNVKTEVSKVAGFDDNNDWGSITIMNLLKSLCRFNVNIEQTIERGKTVNINFRTPSNQKSSCFLIVYALPINGGNCKPCAFIVNSGTGAGSSYDLITPLDGETYAVADYTKDGVTYKGISINTTQYQYTTLRIIGYSALSAENILVVSNT